MKTFYLTLILMLPLLSRAQTPAEFEKKIIQMVPSGRVVEYVFVYQVETPRKTQINIIFDRDNSFKRAEGEDILNDTFFLNENDKSLTDARKILRKEMKIPSGQWTLEKNEATGQWVYAIEGREAGKEVIYNVDVKSGKVTQGLRN